MANTLAHRSLQGPPHDRVIHPTCRGSGACPRGSAVSAPAGTRSQDGCQRPGLGVALYEDVVSLLDP
jgi:hypothetical protein